MSNRQGIVIGDADALIALYIKDDNLHQKIIALNKKFVEVNVRIIFPNTAIAESLTTLQRKFSNATAAALLHQHYKERRFEIVGE